MGQHLSDAPRDIATLTFDPAGDCPSRRYRSSSSICTPSLKFVSLSVRKIWRTSGLNIMSAWWPWPLPMTLKLCVLLPMGWTTFLPILVFLGRFVLDLSANTCQTRNVTLRLWPLTLEVTALSSSYAFLFGRYWAFTVWALIGLWFFWFLNRLTGHPCDRLPSCPIWASQAFPFSSDIKARDRRTDRQTALNLQCPSLSGGGIIMLELICCENSLENLETLFTISAYVCQRRTFSNVEKFSISHWRKSEKLILDVTEWCLSHLWSNKLQTPQ